MDSALRPCFVLPIPELDQAATLLSEAADALIAGDNERARELVRQADMPVLHAYANRIMNEQHDEIHRYRPLSDTSRGTTAVERIALRMPTGVEQSAIYRRDGHRCRYCGCRVVLKSARSSMQSMIPDALNWPSSDKQKHGAFYALNACVDHLVPHARGGDNSPDNLITACWPCNFGKMNFLIQELSLADPRTRSPVVDDWDGLERIVNMRKRAMPSFTSPQEIAAAKSATSQQHTSRKAGKAELDRAEWFRQINLLHANTSLRLIEFLESLADLGVSWSLNEALLVRMTAKGRSLGVLGIEADGGVQVPWMIGDEKQAFKAFALTLGQAIPGSSVYETPRMWRVKGREGLVTVHELLDASDAVREGLAELRRTLDG